MRYTNGGYIGTGVLPLSSGEFDGIWRYYTDVTRNIRNNKWCVSTIPANARVSPSSVVETTGTLITLNCLYDNDPYGFIESFQWQLSSNNITWSNISGAISGSYIFTMTSGNDNTYYRCKIDRAFKNVFSVSSSISVGLNTITISDHPDNSTVYAGEQTTFYVIASVDGGATINYQWQVSTNGGSSWSNAPGSSTSASYSVTPPYSSNGYLYRCYLTASGATPATSNSATLTVNDNPIYIGNQPFSGSCFSPPVNFSIAAYIYYGSPLSYQWYKSSSQSGPFTAITNDSGFSGADTSSLTIDCTQQTSNLYIKCKVYWTIIEQYSDTVLYDATVYTPPPP
jgi:hypothetical protein